jgi:hypothetical protein
MLFATILLLFPFPQTVLTGPTEAASVSENQNLTATLMASNTAADSSLAQPLPSMPLPKVAADAVNADVAALAAPDPIGPHYGALPLEPVKPAVFRPYETERQKKIWYALAFTGHGAAAFDAWSTRRAISGGYGTESNPLLRPFAHSGMLYAATQVSPAVMDLIGRRMMLSQHKWVRRMWWLPQTAGAGFSFAAGVHNVGVVP